MNRQVSMVKDKTKDGAVPGMVESEVRMGENGVHSVFDADKVGCPLAVWWIDRKYLRPCEEAGLPVVRPVGEGGGGRGGIRRRKWRILCI